MARARRDDGRGHAHGLPGGPPRPPRFGTNGSAEQGAVKPQPEQGEPRLRDPGLGDLSRRDYFAILRRAGKSSLADGITDLAAALAYYSFMSIPSALLVAVGVFTLVASPSDISTLIEHVGRVVPDSATSLLDESLRRLSERPSTGVFATAIGFVFALWSTTGAMTAFMRMLNRAYERKETRSFIRQRFVALQMVAAMSVAFVLVFGLLVLGPALSHWIGSALGIERVFGWLWWALQWPVLISGLLAAFATMLYLGPDVDHPRWRFLTPGALLTTVAWLAASGLFAVYTARFASYNKAWGSLATVVVLLTWLWLTSIALILGAEVNAETERSRELRRGEPAEQRLQAQTKA